MEHLRIDDQSSKVRKWAGVCEAQPNLWQKTPARVDLASRLPSPAIAPLACAKIMRATTHHGMTSSRQTRRYCMNTTSYTQVAVRISNHRSSGNSLHCSTETAYRFVIAASLVHSHRSQSVCGNMAEQVQRRTETRSRSRSAGIWPNGLVNNSGRGRMGELNWATCHGGIKTGPLVRFDRR